MDWKKIEIPQGHMLIKAHSFTYMVDGISYRLGVDECSDGKFMGHGEQANDASQQLRSVVAESVEECLSALLKSI